MRLPYLFDTFAIYIDNRTHECYNASSLGCNIFTKGDSTMRLSERDFFLTKLDLSIKEMKDAADLYEAGDLEKARKTFADYMKSTLRPDLRFQLPYSTSKEQHVYDDETWTEMILDGYVAPVGYIYQFPEGKIKWDYNAMPNGYVEWVFHLQYHGELVFLGNAYRKNYDEKYAKRAVEIISSWIEQVERPNGWSPCYRTLETGDRLWNSWPIFIHTFMNSPSVSDELWTKIFISIWEQADWLSRSQANRNWLVTELRGRLSTAVFYPFFKDSKAWYDHSLDKLISELSIQIYPDGVATDRSFSYQEGIIGGFCFAIDLLRTYGREVPESLTQGVLKMCKMYGLMSRPDLMLPQPNDGHILSCVKMSKLGLKYFPDDEELKFFASERKEGKAPEKAMQDFPWSGFSTMRSDWTENAMWFFMDGAGADYNSGWHVHESCLNVEMYAYGTPMLIDTGFFHYDTSKMREYTLASRSHNTGLVDGMGQLCFAKNNVYGFIDANKPGRLTFASSEDFDSVEGYYDFGYGKDFRADKTKGQIRDASGDAYAKHTRKVIFVKKGLGDAKPFFVMLDTFETMDEKEHLYEVNFQLDEVKAEPVGDSVKVTYANGATLSMISTLTPKIILGQTEPELAGWKPELDHHKEHRPAPLVTFAQRGRNALFATVLYPAPDTNAPEIVIDSFDETKVALLINGEKYTVFVK